MKEITCFSYDDQHSYRWDDSSLRYYYPPTLPADLNRGFDTFRALDDTQDDHLDGLLDTISLYEKQKGQRVEADFITWRGLMTKVYDSGRKRKISICLDVGPRSWRHPSRSSKGVYVR